MRDLHSTSVADLQSFVFFWSILSIVPRTWFSHMLSALVLAHNKFAMNRVIYMAWGYWYVELLSHG